ncbi:MAG: arginine--tRNA ligase [bacterium]
MTLEKIKKHISGKCNNLEVKLSPNTEFGDLTIECFGKEKNLAQKLAKKIKPDKIIQQVSSIGPYLNFRINYQEFSKQALKEILENKNYGQNNLGKKQKIMLEFAHPNTHKSFHIGHLRNIITGEALARILENSGYKIIRANYQGDIGLHIAKCLWALPRIKILSKAYVVGNQAYEENKKAKKEIQELNQKIYAQDKSIKKLYLKTRESSLDYFDKIYKRLETKFDRLYFESEVFKTGKKIVLQNLQKGIFKKSKGAIIFEGEKYNLHNRVFVNSQGLATYEAKDLALAELQFKEYSPDKIIHLVGPEQTEYFKVLFKALEQVMPETKNREIHLPYGWVRLKKGKMSSRLGNVILGEWLLDQIKSKLNNQEEVAQAAVKYSILKNNRTQDTAFDIEESINLSGNSGPYLQYTHARIKSILRKSKKNIIIKKIPGLNYSEKNLLLKLALFPEITKQAALEYEPCLIAKYLFDLAQIFNNYYHQTQILKSKNNLKFFRLNLIKAISYVLKRGLELLNINAPEKM